MNSHVFTVAWLLWPLLCVGRLPAYLEPHFTNLPSSRANHENFNNPDHMEEVSTYESPSTNDGITRPVGRVIITKLKATNVAAILRRIPAGFYVSVSIADDHWRTSNNPMHPTTGIAEWNDPIDLPLDVSAEVNVQIYASFEPGNTMEQGELLHKCSITVAELIEHSRSSRPIAFSTTEGDVVSSGTYLQITTETLSPADDSEVVHCRAAARRVDSKADDKPQATVNGQNYIHPRDGHQESPFKRAGRKVKALISSVFRARVSSNVSNTALTAVEQRSNRADLDKAIEHHRSALQLMPGGHPGRSSSLSNLANALSTRFQQQGDGKDLDEAIEHYQGALKLRPEGHPQHSSSLNNLACALWTRFEQQGDGKDLDEAIEYLQGALQLMPECSSSLSNLAGVLLTQFEQQGDGKDLDEAIEYLQGALQLMPEGHPHHSSSLNNLACALLTRFQQRGDGKDLNVAIEHHQSALQLTPEGHPQCSSSLNNLANALRIRFEQKGDEKDLDEAIEYLQGALQLMPEGHPHRSSSLNNLACVLRTRFQQRGDGKDLDVAIEQHQSALQLTPEGHPQRSGSLNNLANALQIRFEQKGDEKDLDEAIEHHQGALQLRPEGHPQHSFSLNNLASTLSKRVEQQGDGKDLDEAIEHFQGALQLRPEGHPQCSSSLNNLAGALQIRFHERGDGKDLDDALQLSYAAVEQSVTASSHLIAHMNLAYLHEILWSTQHKEKNLQDVMYHYKKAAEFAHANLFQGVSCCQKWIRVAEQYHHMSALDAYTKALHLLDYHISATTSVLSQYQAQMHFPPDLAVNAASCALRWGDICYAVELLEQGRALHWTQIARFRTSLEDLYSQDPSTNTLVEQFQNLSALLNKRAELAFIHDKSRSEVMAGERHYRNLLEQWKKVVEEIRTIKGFSHFLLPPLFADLQEAACEGPIIILIASKFSCDAIIVLYMQSPIHLPLKITLKELHDLVFQHLQNNKHPQGPAYTVFIEVMDELWKKVMFPVVQKLKGVVRKHSHIWWCPTSIFTALPLHCAGEYKHGGQVLSKLFVSSYTPSLSALLKAHTRNAKLTQEITFAAIGQATPDTPNTSVKFPPLHYIEHELDGIEALLSIPPVMFTKLMGSQATREQVLQMLVDNQWLHLSCHGMQVPQEPFKSCLAMADGLVSLFDIINANISTHEFAFLSACETAMGDLSTPDEVIHLAAGLQFMGVKSVIGTLWQVHDDVAYKLVLAFYKEFCKNGTLDCTMAARALHAAVATLAKDGVPLQERAMFVHIGI
ncbi:CHAT domain-containing protein [Melanogaster broomeanus]|nr:CHAT domain-containing protein [Melanogaster broomeanus]